METAIVFAVFSVAIFLLMGVVRSFAEATARQVTTLISGALLLAGLITWAVSPSIQIEWVEVVRFNCDSYQDMQEWQMVPLYE